MAEKKTYDSKLLNKSLDYYQILPFPELEIFRVVLRNFDRSTSEKSKKKEASQPPLWCLLGVWENERTPNEKKKKSRWNRVWDMAKTLGMRDIWGMKMEVWYGVAMMFVVSENERKLHRKSPPTSLDENNFSFFSNLHFLFGTTAPFPFLIAFFSTFLMCGYQSFP